MNKYQKESIWSSKKWREAGVCWPADTSSSYDINKGLFSYTRARIGCVAYYPRIICISFV